MLLSGMLLSGILRSGMLRFGLLRGCHGVKALVDLAKRQGTLSTTRFEQYDCASRAENLVKARRYFLALPFFAESFFPGLMVDGFVADCLAELGLAEILSGPFVFS